MKVFISQPMKDRSNEEIASERERIAARLSRERGDVEVLDSFFKDAPANARPLWFLGKSLEILSTADLAVFAKGWQNARGCRIERECAAEYGIEAEEE